MTIKVGIPSTPMFIPLQEALARKKAVQVVTGTGPEVARQLRSGELDTALVSAIEYARESSNYRILPDVAISSRSGVALYFRRGLRSVKTLAADPSCAAEIVLTTIMLAEEFEISPAIVPVPHPSLDEMLRKADAAMLSGEAFLRHGGSHAEYIDIVELWSELTDLPFVHGLFCTKDEVLKDTDLMLIGSAARRATPFEPGPLDAAGVPPEALEEYLAMFSYELTQEVQDALREFLQYAHYHGVLADIPDLMLYTPKGNGDFSQIETFPEDR